MSRRLLGRHEPSAGLTLSHTGPPGPAAPVLCLFDGHLDNAAELAAGLPPGEPDRTPEELLAAGYRRWGADLPARMRGDFFLVIWDAEAGAGLLARDQLGARPAYLRREGRTLRFSNRLADLLESLPRRPEPDPASVAHWIAASSRPGQYTLYRGVERLGPGTMVLLDRAGARAVRYWEPRYQPPLELPLAELAERVHGGLRLAVRRRLAPGAPTAVLLSGGLDSSAVAATAVELGGEVRACSASFPDHPLADEAALIAELRSQLGLRGPSAAVRSTSALAAAAEYVAACGLPPLGWGDFWTLPLLREAAREGAANVLGGDGGDELFGPRQNLLADALRAGRLSQALALAGELPGAGPHVPRREVARLLAGQALTALPRRPHRRVVDLRERRRLPSWLLAESRRALIESEEPVPWKRLDGPLWWAEVADGVANQLDQAGVFEHQRYRAELTGIEARHPLLDLDLVELCLRQPPEATLDRRFNRPVLREAVAGLVPDSVRLRPAKARFESVLVGCLSGPDLPGLRSLLLDRGAEVGAYVDRAELRGQLFDGGGEVELGSFRWMWLVWRLATAELWLRAERDEIRTSTTFFNLTIPCTASKILSNT